MDNFAKVDMLSGHNVWKEYRKIHKIPGNIVGPTDYPCKVRSYIDEEGKVKCFFSYIIIDWSDWVEEISSKELLLC